MSKKKLFLVIFMFLLLCCACGKVETNLNTKPEKQAYDNSKEVSAVKLAPPTDAITIEKGNLMTAGQVLKLHPLTKRDAKTPHITAICYHEVNDNSKDPYAITPKIFQTHLREFKAAGYNFIDIEDLRAYKEQRKSLPKDPLFISFDDGYLDNYTHMFPIAQAEKAKVTVFIAAGLMEGKNYLTWKQIREMLAGGIKIGCHTMNHAQLVGLSAKELDVELVDSKKLLEKELHTDIYAIAFPCGYATPEVLQRVKKYYTLGFYANVDDNREETMYTFNRYGVFRWNEHIRSIFCNNQPRSQK